MAGLLYFGDIVNSTMTGLLSGVIVVPIFLSASRVSADLPCANKEAHISPTKRSSLMLKVPQKTGNPISPGMHKELLPVDKSEISNSG